jgi:predicted patatin/cPLA2 family phospholipase
MRARLDTEQLLDWTLASSTIPPFTRIQREAGRTYLDGGLVDNAPIRALPVL